MKSKEPKLEVMTKLGDDLYRLNHYSHDGGYIGTFTGKGLKEREKAKAGKKAEKKKKGVK